MSVPQKEKHVIPPLKISALLHTRWATQVLKTAVELNLFSHIAGSLKTADEIAELAGIDSRGSGVLLDALVGLELIRRNEDRYALTESSQVYLMPESKLYMGEYIERQDELMTAWEKLTEIITTGKPALEVDREEIAKQFFPSLVSAIFPANYTTACMVADELAVHLLKPGSRVLDVAAGSGVWSIAMAEVNRQLEIDALDLSAVVPVTCEFAERFGVGGRYSYLSGNWRDISLADERYDIIILGHILHAEGVEGSRKLLLKCVPALKPGGRLVVAEFLANDTRTAPVFPLLFAINMFLATSSGCVFTAGELQDLLLSVGLRNPQRLDLPYWGEESPTIVASR